LGAADSLNNSPRAEMSLQLDYGTQNAVPRELWLADFKDIQFAIIRDPQSNIQYAIQKLDAEPKIAQQQALALEQRQQYAARPYSAANGYYGHNPLYSVMPIPQGLGYGNPGLGYTNEAGLYTGMPTPLRPGHGTGIGYTNNAGFGLMDRTTPEYATNNGPGYSLGYPTGYNLGNPNGYGSRSTTGYGLGYPTGYGLGYPSGYSLGYLNGYGSGYPGNYSLGYPGFYNNPTAATLASLTPFMPPQLAQGLYMSAIATNGGLPYGGVPINPFTGQPMMPTGMYNPFAQTSGNVFNPTSSTNPATSNPAAGVTNAERQTTPTKPASPRTTNIPAIEDSTDTNSPRQPRRRQNQRRQTQNHNLPDPIQRPNKPRLPGTP